MGETPEQLAQGRGDYTQSLIGHRITDLTGTTATSGVIPYIDTDGTLQQSSALTFAGTTLSVIGTVQGSTVVLSEVSDPGAASENSAILYLTNVSGSSVLRVRFNAADSQAQTVATEQ